MICEQCQKEELKSRIDLLPMGVRTAMGWQDFYDEDGKFHCHDPNVTTFNHKCSNGHEFSKSQKETCWCGWGKE
jgi:hypothetical protein